MPHYTSYKRYGNSIVLNHADGSVFCASQIDAEQKLQMSIHLWAGENVDKAKEEMALLTRLIREQ